MSELNYLTATEMAAAIRERRCSATELLEALLQQIARHNPTLRAISTLDEPAARSRAKDADAALAHGEHWGPLHGVPVTIKDVFETKGLLTTSSFRPLANHVPTRDATVVARLRNAGAIILGKTNVPMLGIDAQTYSPLFGRACNPWNKDCTPGGSSGGGAAALAAGMSPLDMGSDLAGSLRLPAHCCGVFSIKPTEHCVSLAGHIPELPGQPWSTRHLHCAGPMARSVADLRLALSLVAGPDERRWEVPPVPMTPAPRRRLRDCRFAWSDSFGDLPVAPDISKALARLAADLSAHGCRVEKCNPPKFEFNHVWETFAEIAGSEVGAGMSTLPRLVVKLQFKLMAGPAPIKRGILRGAKLNMRRYMKMLARRDAHTAALESFLHDFDAWLCPVSTMPAFPHCKKGKRFVINGQTVHYLMAAVGHSCIFNMTGGPVVTLPIGLSANGLPIGVQVIGRRWRDMELLSVAEAMTDITGPFRRPPGYETTPR